MEKRLKQIVSLLISVMLIIGSMPIGVLAEAVSQPTPTKTTSAENLVEEDFAPTEVKGPTATEPTVPQTEPVVTEAEPTLVTPEVNQSMSTSETVIASETMTVMATDGDYEYDDSIDGVATITKYIGSATNVTIPTMLGGRKVVAIKGTNTSGAFTGNTTVQKIIIPMTVTTIESGDTTATYTFGGCSSLTEVLIPISVKTISAYAFSNTTGVKISGYKGSQAEKYASEHNNVTFNTLNFSVTLTPSLPSSQNIGTSLTLTAAATGGTGTLNYKFYYDLEKLDGTKKTATIQSLSSASSTEFQLTEAGTYTYYVDLQDGAGNMCTNIIDNYKVIDQPMVNFTSSVLSPQYKDVPIEFTATVSGGTGPYSYEFYHTIGIQTVVDKPKTSTSDTSMSWTTAGFTTVGTYTFYVKVTDKYGEETIKTISDYKIYEYLKVDGFTVDKASPQELGTELKLTATASGGKTDCEYKFSYTVDGGTEVVIQDYSDQSSITFSPPKTGSYTFIVEVTNGYGLVERKEVTGYEIRDTPEIGNFTAAKEDGTPFYVGDTAGVVLTAEGVAGGKPNYSYKYFYQIGTGTKTELTAADSTKNSYTYSPTTAGTYTFFVEVTDANGLKIERQVSNYVVYPKLDGTLTLPASQNRETTVKFAATATGGKSTYKYQFFYKLASEGDDKYIPMTDEPSTTKTFSKYFSDPGSYEIKLEITDANGITTKIEKPLEIKNNPLIEEFNIPDDAFYADQEMELTAKVDPIAAGLTLVLTAKMGTKSVTIPNSTITMVAATNTFKFTPTAAGTYTFTVTLKNADGTVADTKTISSIKVLAAPSAKAVKVSKTSGVLLGDTVKLTAAGTGGKTAYQYKFWVKKPDGTSEAINTSFSTTNSINYTMPAVGVYIFYVEILDANNKPSDNKEESASVPIKVTNPPVITDFYAAKVTTGTETAVVYEKDKVKLTAKLEDGKGHGDLTCEFFYKQGAQEIAIGTPVTVLEASTNRIAESTANFIPPAAGSYTLLVKVTDKQGTKVTKTITGYKALPLGSSKSVKLSKTEGLLVGDTIKLTASASGGKTPYNYQFYVKGPADAVEQPYGEITKESTISYPLTAVGVYTFSVEITDVNGVVLATTAKTISQTVAVTNPPDLTTLTVVKDQTIGTKKNTPVAYEEDTLIITAEKEASTGVAPITYVFEAKLGTSVVKKIEQTNDNVFTYTPDQPGSYSFTVTATDSLKTKDIAKKTGYKVLPDVITKSVKASKTTDLVVGEAIILTAAGSGGQTPYNYDFYYYLDGVKTEVPITSDPKSKTATFAPATKGNYEFHVKITDANGVVCTNHAGLDVSTTATVGNPPVIESLIADKVKGTPVYPGDSVVLTAKVKKDTGLKNPTYDFYYTSGTTRISIPITTPSTLADPYTAAATFTPSQAGTYNLCVDVFDGTTTATQKISSYKVLPGVEVKTFKTDKASGINIGTTVKLTAAGTGGKGPYMYEFSWIYQDKTTDTIKAYSTDATANFIPTKAGFYTLQVNVKDATGKTCGTAGTIQDFEVVDYPVIKTFTSSLPSGQYVETPIELSATVSGGLEPYTYAFSYQINSGTAVPIEATTASPTNLTTNKAILKLPSAGTYTFIVTVKDSNGSPVATKKIEKYLVYAEPSMKTVTVAKDTIVLGGSVSVKATAEGGQKPLKYQFVFTGDKGTVVTIGYSTTSSVYFKPTTAETYTVKVNVQDVNEHPSVEMAGDKTITVTPKPTT